MNQPTFTQQSFFPPAPAPQPAPPPAPERQFYLVEPTGGYQHPVGPIAESQVVSDWISKGWDGPLFLVGGPPENGWKDAKFYGLKPTVGPPQPAQLPASSGVAVLTRDGKADVVVQPAFAQAPVAQPAVQRPIAAQPENSRPTVAAMLKAFSKLPGCEDYKNDGPRVDLLVNYLWIRLLTPNLSFEKFLELFSAVADFDEKNLKHPEAAIKSFCPRTGKAAEESGHKWSAAEVVRYVSLYVDMIREAEDQKQPVPLTFAQFLPALKDQFLAGAFDVAEPAEEKAKKPRKAADTSVVAIAPTVAGQRIVYTMPTDGGRQIRGKVDAITVVDARSYVTFTADSGEVFKDINIQHCNVVEDTPLPGYRDTAGAPKGELERKRLFIPKGDAPRITEALNLKQAVGNVAIGDGMFTYTQPFSHNFEATIAVINGESGPFVNAELSNAVDQAFVPVAIPPRSNIEGEYVFPLANGLLVLEVSLRE
jgi:hypothetical protein